MMKYYRAPDGNRDVYCLALFPDGGPVDESGLPEKLFPYGAVSMVQQVNMCVAHSLKELMPLGKLKHVSLEMEKPGITTDLEDYNHPEQAVYVVGNSEIVAPALLLDLDEEPDRVHVKVPTPVFPDYDMIELSLYGFQILPIVLYDRWRKLNASL